MLDKTTSLHAACRHATSQEELREACFHLSFHLEHTLSPALLSQLRLTTPTTTRNSA